MFWRPHLTAQSVCLKKKKALTKICNRSNNVARAHLVKVARVESVSEGGLEVCSKATVQSLGGGHVGVGGVGGGPQVPQVTGCPRHTLQQ